MPSPEWTQRIALHLSIRNRGVLLKAGANRKTSKRPPAKRVALNSPRSDGFKVGTSALTILGLRTTGRASGLKINQYNIVKRDS